MVLRRLEPMPSAWDLSPAGPSPAFTKKPLARDETNRKLGTLSTRFVRNLLDGSLLNEPAKSQNLPVHDAVFHEFYPTSDSGHEQATYYCTKCHLHFFIHSENNMPPPPGHDDHNIPCGTKIVAKEFPAHHIIEDEIVTGFDACQASSIYYHLKYHPVSIIGRYSCSNPRCSFKITIEVSPPRLTPSLTDKLINQAGLDSRKTQAINLGLVDEKTAENYATPEVAYNTTIRVIKDLIYNPYQNHMLRKFDTRTNGKFLMIFGGENIKWLQYLELTFSQGEPGEDEVEGPSIWRFPEPPNRQDEYIPGTQTPLIVATRTSFYQQCLAELQCKPGLEGHRGEIKMDPKDVLRTIVVGLGPVEKRTAATDDDNDNHQAYKTIGVLRADSSQMVSFAYERQIALCPSMRGTLATALGDISMLRGDSDLQVRAAQEQSLAEQEAKNEQMLGDAAHDALRAVEEAAYKYLLVGTDDLASAKKYPDISIIGLARNRLEACPTDNTTLEKLEDIANARNSEEIRNFIDVMKVEAAGGPMAPSDAYRLLDLDYSEYGPGGNIDKEIVVNVARANASESIRDKKLVAEALRIIAGQFENDTALLADANIYDPQPGFTVVASNQDSFGRPPTVAPMAGPDAVGLPVGLYNIGNTCYLNSLLQYLHTVKPIQTLLAEYNQHKLDLSPESIEARRIGSNKTLVGRAEAIAARQFVEELATLFKALHKSPRTFVRPKQRLANAALLSVHQLLANAKKQKEEHATAATSGAPAASTVPPELPPRPKSSTTQNLPSPPLSEDVDMVNSEPSGGSGLAVVGEQETASHSSTQTLVNQDGDALQTSCPKSVFTPGPKVSVVAVDDNPSEPEPHGDVHMKDATNEGTSKPSRPTTPSTAKPDGDVAEADEMVSHALENSDRPGTYQEDVEEVMGKIMLRMQEAIKPTGEGLLFGKTMMQLDQIMDTFYIVLVNYTAKAAGDGTIEEVSHDRWLTAYPDAKAAVTMYEALDITFDKQFLSGTQRPRYSVIRRLPPILHICIQRSMVNGEKNLNKVEIPLVLHLDRYMEDVDEDEELSELRDRAWEIKMRLGRLRSQTADEESAENPPSKGADAVESSKKAAEAISTLIFGVPPSEGDMGGGSGVPFNSSNSEPPTLESETATLNPNDPPTPPEPEISPADEAKKREDELNQLWEGRKNSAYKYHLHAILCHSGKGSNVGHYWVFIYDFTQEVWYKFNDENVTKHSHEEAMRMIETMGNPYYVAYVHAGNEAELVDIPQRSPQVDADDDGDIPVLEQHGGQGPVVYGPQPKPVGIGPHMSSSAPAPASKLVPVTLNWGALDATMANTAVGQGGNSQLGNGAPPGEVEMGGMDTETGANEHLPSYDESEAMVVDDQRPLSANPTLERQLSEPDTRSGWLMDMVRKSYQGLPHKSLPEEPPSDLGPEIDNLIRNLGKVEVFFVSEEGDKKGDEDEEQEEMSNRDSDY
ncbi:ubiquitin carboxyl-terminal hydrolase [Zalerion maritima]|uniref:ubiquitinyl hydrolase 1 n=1 Tax=Zalerion maritima TaxID=339359 RepID=A0AAD5WT62_9PEZI|nr:ubiquitin carboxyl-terminal hydrolase [Zalerion maritima]